MTELKRSMGFFALLALSISSMVSTEMFTGAAIGAKYAGPGSIISWVLLGCISIYVALCYGELCSMFPTAGGNYEYAKQTYGRFVSYLIGWGTWVLSNIVIVILAMAAINSLLPSAFPSLYKILIVSGFIILLNLVAMFGVEASSLLMIVFAIITVFTLVSIFIKGIFNIKLVNFTPFYSVQGFNGIVTATLLLAESVLGWESATYLSEETENPEKKIPKVILIATIFTAIINILVAFVVLGLIPSGTLGYISEPFNAVITTLFGASIVPLTNMLIYLILIGSAASSVVSTPRLLLAMARDKLFLKQLNSIHPKFNTPYKAIIFQTIVSLIFIFLGFGNYNILLQIMIPLAIIIYSVIIIAVTILRVKKPELKRPFRAPFGKIGPVLTTLFFISVLIFWIITEKDALSITLLGFSIIGLGIPIYFLLMMYYNPNAIKIVNNVLAYAYLATEDIYVPKKIRTEVINELGDLKNKTVLDYECNAGTLTLPLSKVSKKVYATDISVNQVNLTNSRAKKENISNITGITSSPDEISPKVPLVDSVVSIGGLSNIQDIVGFLKKINKRIKKNGKIVFLEYDKFFYIIPNKIWLNDDEKIKKKFSDSGFSIKIRRKRGLLWTYIFITGKKI